MSSVRTALAWSFVERYALIAVGLASYVLIARLLTPHQIGLYSVAAALIGIAQVVRDFGVANYIIQERLLSQEHVESAFGFALLAGLVVFGLVIAAAPVAARVYGDADVATILRIVALNLLILPFCSIALGMLRRSMRFDRLMAVNLAGSLIGVATTIGLALAGEGPSSLAWGTVATNVTTAAGAWASLSPEHRPTRPRLTLWRSILDYGKQSTLAGVVVTSAMDINDLVVGKVLGFAPVALLNRAMGVTNLFSRELIGAARNVAFPAFAAAIRQGQPTEPMFVYSYSAVTVFGWPFFGFVALFPLETLRLLAGPQWDGAVPYLVILCLAGALSTTSTLISPLVLAAGRVELASRAELFANLGRVLLVSASAIVFRDLMAVALALLASLVLSVPLFFFYKQRCLPSDWWALARSSGRSFVVTASCLLLPAFLSLASGWSRTAPISGLNFAAAIVMTMIGWLVALRLLRHPVSRDPIFVQLSGRFRTLLRRTNSQ